MASQDTVLFVSVLKNYPPGEKLEVSYSLNETMTPTSRDWVGLFRVGWSSSRDYYTFEWAPAPTENKGSVVFAGRRLPPEDKHFYQFCYVSADGRVRGASSPFQFTTAANSGDKLEDLELVEVSEDSIMVLQPKEVPEPEPKKAELERELVNVKESFVKLETEKEVLVGKFEEERVQILEELTGVKKELTGVKEELAGTKEDLAQVKDELRAAQEKSADLEQQLQAKRESENRLMEKLEKERALNHELTTAKAKEESKAKLLQEQVTEMEAISEEQQKEGETKTQTIENLELQVMELSSGKERLETQLRECVALLDERKNVEIQLMAQVTEKNQEIERNIVQMTEMQERFTEDYEKVHKEKDQLLQEVAVGQQNIVELVGAKKDGVPVDIEVPAHDSNPPTLPTTATPAAMVDKSAYEVLQQACDDIEDRYQKCFEENRELRTRYQAKKVKLEETQAHVAELTHRVEVCRVEYEKKCKEVLEARRGQQQPLGNVASLQSKLEEMEDNQEQLTTSLDAAVKELASRREELKEKSVQLAEAQEKVGSLEETLCLVQEEFREFQDKHDSVINEKVARMDELKDTIQVQEMKIASLEEALHSKEKEMIEFQGRHDQIVHDAVAPVVKEKSKLEQVLHQLREQLQTLKLQAKVSDKTCPVCSTKFPGRISQFDFEKHVQAHFNS